MSVFVIANDLTALSVALPQIEQDLDSDVSTIQWVVSAYALVFGVLIVTGGRLADMLGRRRIFFIGAAIFAAFSVLGGFAQSDIWLIACRALMGVGGAMMWPAVLGHDLRHPARRARGAGRRAHHRLGRLRQRGRPAARGRAHRRAELAMDPVRQPADSRVRLLRHLAKRAREHRRGRRRGDRRAGRGYALDQPGGSAAGARPGDDLGLDRPAHPGTVRRFCVAAGGVRAGRAPRRERER